MNLLCMEDMPAGNYFARSVASAAVHRDSSNPRIADCWELRKFFAHGARQRILRILPYFRNKASA